MYVWSMEQEQFPDYETGDEFPDYDGATEPEAKRAHGWKRTSKGDTAGQQRRWRARHRAHSRVYMRAYMRARRAGGA
jgi:hypothetical protein